VSIPHDHAKNCLMPRFWKSFLWSQTPWKHWNHSLWFKWNGYFKV